MHYYTDPNEKVRIAIIAQTLGFSTLLVYLSLIPFDVYTTVNHYSHILLKLTTYDLYFGTIIFLYLILVVYWLALLLCFVILPFTYFYSE